MTLRRIVVFGLWLMSASVAAQTEKPATAPPAAPAAAAPAGVKPDSPCKEDVEAFCADVQAGGGRIYKCLTEKEQELSNSCKARLAELRATGGECKRRLLQGRRHLERPLQPQVV